MEDEHGFVETEDIDLSQLATDSNEEPVNGEINQVCGCLT